MHVFLVRHAHAVDAVEDPERPLSKRGRDQVRALAKFLRQNCFELATDHVSELCP